MALKNLNSLSQLAKMARNSNGREVLSVSVDDVVSKDQVRKKFKNIEELGETMKTEGQQSPIIVYPKNSIGKYVIQKGERRWRAIKWAQLPTIDIMVNVKDQSRLDEIAGELIENIQRDNLTAMEIAHALLELKESGLQQKDLAKRIGKSTSYVSVHLALCDLPKSVQTLFDQDVTNDADTLYMLRQVYELDPKRGEIVCKMAMQQGVTRKHVRELLDAIKLQIKEKKARATEQAHQAETAHESARGEPGNKSSAQPVAQDPAVAEDAKPTKIVPKSPVSTAKPPKQENENPFLEENERKSIRAEQPDAEQNAGQEVAPAELVIAVLVMDESNWEGELILNRLADSESEAWVRNLVTNESVCVKLSNLQLTGMHSQ
ncbi:ParB/RepB/Spo0J family partition protein [Eoetvoesiella caeni]